ncbi:MAG TPA: SGNH/GDSL hydrolase family protein [Pseudonocardiaceae bacterium]
MSRALVLIAATSLVGIPVATPANAATFTSLAAAFDNTGISDNANTAGANLDGSGNSLSAQDLLAAGWSPGTAMTVDNTPFTWPTAPTATPDNVVAGGQVIDVTGSGSALQFIATANNGPITSNGTITYTDGSTQPYTIAVPDWFAGNAAPRAVGLPHWNTRSGQQAASIKLYPESVPLNANKTVRSVTLPNVSNGVAPGVPALHVFAVGVRPGPGAWTGTWSAAPDVVSSVGPWTQQTLRMVVHDSVGGNAVRLRLANTFAGSPVVIGHATVAVQNSGGTATGPPVSLTFGGRRQATIPAGGELVGDGASATIPANANLLVSVYFPGPVTFAMVHSLAQTTSFTTPAGAGDHTADVAAGAFTGTFGFWTFLGGVDVMASGRPGTVIALGDSITDGVGSTVNANHRWPNLLANRLTSPHFGVLDEGISGNKVVSDQFTDFGVSAVNRLDRDVIDQPDARTLIVFEGINDVKGGTPAAQVIAGIQQIAARAHAFGLRVLIATIAPFQGWSEFTPASEAAREAVNNYIRTTPGFLDFDQVLRDPANTLRLLPAFDSGDHLHPNDAGYQAVANSVNLGAL